MLYFEESFDLWDYFPTCLPILIGWVNLWGAKTRWPSHKKVKSLSMTYFSHILNIDGFYLVWNDLHIFSFNLACIKQSWCSSLSKMWENVEKKHLKECLHYTLHPTPSKHFSMLYFFGKYGPLGLFFNLFTVFVWCEIM